MENDLSAGDELWEKYKRNTEMRYHMSQTNTSLQTLNANLRLKQTIIEPDALQPSKEELMSQFSVEPTAASAFKSKGGRIPSYYFAEEKYMMRREKQYQKAVIKSRLQAQYFRRLTRNEFDKEHRKIIKMVGPEWYQEPSMKQMSSAESLQTSIPHDLKNMTTRSTMFYIIQIGILPLPHPQLVWRAIRFSSGDPVEFLLALYQLMDPNRKEYSVNDRIILSAVTHLALPETLRELNVRIPSPPPAEKPKPKKGPRPQKMNYESPYLVPYTFKPTYTKPEGEYTKDRDHRPFSNYFAYRKEFKKLNYIPDKSEYKYKYKADQRANLKMKPIKPPPPKVLGKIEPAGGDAVRKPGKTVTKSTAMPPKHAKSKPQKSIEEVVAHKPKICFHPDTKHEIVTAVQLTKTRTPPVERPESRHVTSAATSIVSNRTKKRKKRHSKKSTKQGVKGVKGTGIDWSPTHLIHGGVTIHDEKPVKIVHGISKLDHHKRFYNYIIGGVAILPDGSTVHIISGIKYEPLKEYCTFVMGGVKLDEEGEPIPIISGVSGKPFADEIEEEPKEPPPPTKEYYCSCLKLYEQYMQIKMLEHERCMTIYRQYIVRKRQNELKSQPEITYVIGGVTETEEGPTYLVSGIHPPKPPMYEQVVGGVVHNPDGSPTFIISGLTATRIYYEYMESVKENLKKMAKNAYIIGGVTTSPYGVPNLIISGVAVRKPEERPMRVHIDGVQYTDSGTVIVTDEGVTNPWLQNKYSCIIGGVTTSDDGQPIYIVQGLGKVGEEEPKYTYVLGGVKQTESGHPLFVVSGVTGGEEQMKEMFKPKCQYVIGAVKKLENGVRTFVIQGLVIEKDEVPQPCEYVIGGTKTLYDGTIVPIITGCVPRKEQECECLIMYRNYMMVQAKKHKKCMDLYEKYVKKKEKIERTALEERKRGDTTLIIGGIQRNPDGTPMFIITGLAAKRLFDEYCKTPELPQPMNVIVGGVTVDEEGVPEFIISGLTSHLAGKRPVLLIGGVREKSDGSPQYIVTGVQAVPSAVKSIREIKKQITVKKDIMIIGGVQTLEDGTSTFIINGVTTCEFLEDVESEQCLPPRVQILRRQKIIGGIQILRDGTATTIINGITISPVWEDQSEEEKMCKCMKLYRRWLELEGETALRNVQYEEEIIEGVGRRIDDVIIPYFHELPDKTEFPKPKKYQLLPMPRKFHKISCNRSEQIKMLKRLLSGMADDGYPLAKLPKCWLLPQFKLWMDLRCGKIMRDKDRDKLLVKSRAFWNHMAVCPISVPKPDLGMSEKQLRSITWGKIKWCRAKVRKAKEVATTNLRQALINKQREFWPTTYPYDIYNNSFIDVFYAYGPACESDILAIRPWQPHEHKNLGSMKRG